MDITWHAFSLREGLRGPQVVVANSGTLSRFIGAATDTDVLVRMVDDAGDPLDGWLAATQPGAAMLVALDELEQPVWAGMALRRRADAGVWATISTASTEAYFDRRYVSTLTFTQTDQAAIVQGLIAGVVTDGIEITVDAPATGTKRDRTYLDDDDKTVGTALTELSDIIGGVEWTVDLRWANEDRVKLERVLRVRPRLGSTLALPTARFDLPGNVATFDYTEDYTDGFGANDVLATSSGEGDVRPKSQHMRPADLAGRPIFEHRYSPSTSITNLATLNAHARATVTEMADGLAQLDVEANLDTAPLPGRDWYLGDEVAVSLTCPRFPERVNTDGQVVAGYVENVRAVGWEIDFDARRLKPTLVEAHPVEVAEL